MSIYWMKTADVYPDGHWSADSFVALDPDARFPRFHMVEGDVSTALADTEAADVVAEPLPTGTDEATVTTEEEREGFMIVRAIVRDILKPARVVMRDQKSYCGILVDDNNRRPLARLHLNRSIKYIGLFDGEKEERVKIDTSDEIYDYAERLRATAQVYSAS